MALRHLDEWVAEEQVSEELSDAVRSVYDAASGSGATAETPGSTTRESTASLSDVRRRLLVVQDRARRQLHRDGAVSFSVIREVERELDLEPARLEH